MNDIAFTATVRADRMRWDDDPDARVTFHGTPGYRSVSDSDRVNLPYRVRAETTYRDRTGLLQALLDHSETRFQESFLEGPPPLGPGAPARERLLAFGPAALRHDSGHLDLYLAGEPKPSRRHTLPSRKVRHTHIAMLLREADAGGDTELLAHTLLGYLDTVLVQHLLVQRGMPLDRLEDGWCDLVRRMVG
ncbi:TetR/AcrR family transcriptional regulator [Prauserella oleivorans]|uniref:TetR/AcrR family transcriptional regulator n=1 Tax=Prauserella oleivorans TaxID=1478153 RepID=A0ABW5WGF3_9PSEU